MDRRRREPEEEGLEELTLDISSSGDTDDDSFDFSSDLSSDSDSDGFHFDFEDERSGETSESDDDFFKQKFAEFGSGNGFDDDDWDSELDWDGDELSSGNNVGDDFDFSFDDAEDEPVQPRSRSRDVERERVVPPKTKWDEIKAIPENLGFGGVMSSVKNGEALQKIKSLNRKTWLMIGGAVILLIVVSKMLFGGEDEPLVASEGENGSQVEQTSEKGSESVSDENTTLVSGHEVEIVPNENDNVVKEKAKELSSKEHYNENVDLKEDGYNRTSLYDKPIGRIYAPNVNIDETIYAGASELNMRRGVATVEYLEQLDEQTVAIAGHRSKNPTQFLTGALYLQKGDFVYVEQWDENGNTVGSTEYVVEELTKVVPSDISVLEDTKNDSRRKLVLITCSDYNPKTGKYDKRWVTIAYERK